MWAMLMVGAAAVMIVMTLLWGLGVRQRNFSYVDLGWAGNFMLLALLYAVMGEGDVIRRIVLSSMYVLWSLRLTLHLATRIIGEPEEGRYVQLRSEWGTQGNLNLKFLGFFQFQAVLNIFLALPLLLVSMNVSPSLHGLEIVGITVWVIALLGETVADAQLKKFKKDPNNQGKVCDVGLWSWSRHPNYFFEWIIWVSYAVFALASPWGWLSLGLPVLMLHFLLNVTGIKATEEQALRSKGEAYRQYQREVSAFIPLPRKRVS